MNEHSPVSPTLLPPSTLIEGPAGVGKTSSIVTLLQLGIKVRMLAFEPSAPNRVLDRARQINFAIPPGAFEWCFVSPAVPSWDNLIESANVVQKQTLDEIAKLRIGIAKPDASRWVEMLQHIADFRSQRTGESLGDATEWGADCAFIVDGLTGLSTMSRNMTVGLKPNPAPGEWGVMQNNILTLINKLCADCRCYFVLIAHVERETNELTGLQQVTVSTLGAKLAPKLPPLFTNVVYAKRVKDVFLWSTADTGVDTKSGDLPLADDLSQSFKPIVDSFRARLEAAKQTAGGTAQGAVPEQSVPTTS